jgi:hypothetical protein
MREVIKFGKRYSGLNLGFGESFNNSCSCHSLLSFPWQ